MSKTSTYQQARNAFASAISDYKQLVKFRLNLMVVMSAVLAFLIAAAFNGTGISWVAVSCIALGGFMVTGAANALNQVLEKDFDRLMKRTADRPLATGRMTISHAVLVAGFMALIGITVLSLFNPLTGLLSAASLIIYSFIYTPMKRVGPISVWIGAIPGALPTLIG